MKILGLILLIMCSTNLLATTVIVSDIDDTLKNAHARSKIGILTRAFATNARLKGMAETFKVMLSEDDDVKLYYLTNAPKSLMFTSHNSLLRKGNFPKAPVLFRDGDSSTEHKINRLNEIIKKDSPDTMILLGDNGEHDPGFYRQIQVENPSIKIVTMIRTFYPIKGKGALKTTQTPFLGPVEIALRLEDEGLLSLESADKLINNQIKLILAQKRTGKFKPKYFPRWTNCSGFKWAYETSRDGIVGMSKYLSKIKNLCGGKL